MAPGSDEPPNNALKLTKRRGGQNGATLRSLTQCSADRSGWEGTSMTLGGALADSVIRECGCPCHYSDKILHPVPCCTPCQRCGILVARGVAVHHCDEARVLLRAASSAPGSLARGLAKYDAAFAVLMALLVMGLAVYAAGPAAGVLLGVAALGLGLGIAKLKR